MNYQYRHPSGLHKQAQLQNSLRSDRDATWVPLDGALLRRPRSQHPRLARVLIVEDLTQFLVTNMHIEEMSYLPTAS